MVLLLVVSGPQRRLPGRDGQRQPEGARSRSRHDGRSQKRAPGLVLSRRRGGRVGQRRPPRATMRVSSTRRSWRRSMTSRSGRSSASWSHGALVARASPVPSSTQPSTTHAITAQRCSRPTRSTPMASGCRRRLPSRERWGCSRAPASRWSSAGGPTKSWLLGRSSAVGSGVEQAELPTGASLESPASASTCFGYSRMPAVNSRVISVGWPAPPR